MWTWLFGAPEDAPEPPSDPPATPPPVSRPRRLSHTDRLREVEPGVWSLDDYGVMLTDTTSRLAMYTRTLLFRLGDHAETRMLHRRLRARFDDAYRAHVYVMQNLFPRDAIHAPEAGLGPAPTAGQVLVHTSNELDRLLHSMLQRTRAVRSEAGDDAGDDDLEELDTLLARMGGAEDVRQLAMWRDAPAAAERGLALVPTEVYDAYRLAGLGSTHVEMLLDMWHPRLLGALAVPESILNATALHELGIGSMIAFLAQVRSSREQALLAGRRLVRALEPRCVDLPASGLEALNDFAAALRNYEKMLGVLQHSGAPT